MNEERRAGIANLRDHFDRAARLRSQAISMAWRWGYLLCDSLGADAPGAWQMVRVDSRFDASRRPRYVPVIRWRWPS